MRTIGQKINASNAHHEPSAKGVSQKHQYHSGIHRVTND